MQRILPVGLDLLIVVVFALVGRLSHAREWSLTGLGETAWPFLVACLLGWGVVLLLGAEGYRMKTALIVWLVTVLGGIALRLNTDNTADPAFFAVTAGVLGAAFFGWRLLVMWWRGRASDAKGQTTSE